MTRWTSMAWLMLAACQGGGCNGDKDADTDR
jgi:hypothetical protein